MNVFISMAAFALAASITPGPVNIVGLSSGARYGFWPSMRHVMGATLGFILLLVLAGFGVHEVLLVAANTTGGVTGKMISPQSIAIACAAVGLAGRESDLFRFTLKHSLAFCAMIGIITTVQAYWLTWMIP